MKKIMITCFAVGLLAAGSACTTVVEKHPTTSTTTTEQTHTVQPVAAGVSTETTRTMY